MFYSWIKCMRCSAFEPDNLIILGRSILILMYEITRHLNVAFTNFNCLWRFKLVFNCSSSFPDYFSVSNSYWFLSVHLHHRCQTQGPWAKSGPPHHFMWPLTTSKTYNHLFFKKCTNNILCFYFEGFKLNGFML